MSRFQDVHNTPYIRYQVYNSSTGQSGTSIGLAGAQVPWWNRPRLSRRFMARKIPLSGDKPRPVASRLNSRRPSIPCRKDARVTPFSYCSSTTIRNIFTRSLQGSGIYSDLLFFIDSFGSKFSFVMQVHCLTLIDSYLFGGPEAVVIGLKSNRHPTIPHPP